MPCRSLTSLRNKFRAVIFFYRHLLSPIASIFGSGMPYAARTFLSHPPVENASDKPEHCFRNAKIAKKFDLTANFSEFLNSFRFLGMILLLFHPERLTFQSSFSLVYLVCRSHCADLYVCVCLQMADRLLLSSDCDDLRRSLV